MTRYTALDIAKYLIHLANNAGNPLDKMGIQKLLYYAQGEYLAQNDTALFDDPLQAWTYGPVQPDIWKNFDSIRGDAVSLDPAVENHLQSIFTRYGHIPSTTLSDMTHSEQPWIQTRGNLGDNDPSNREISPLVMKNFFKRTREERETYSKQIKIMKRIVKEDRNILNALAKA